METLTQPRTIRRDPLISRKECMKLLGMSQPTLWRMTKAGVIPAYQVGGRVKYDPIEIAIYLERNRYKVDAWDPLHYEDSVDPLDAPPNIVGGAP